MICPSCGASASTGQKFCRFCGVRLQVVSHAQTKQGNQIRAAYSRETKLERWTNQIGCLSGTLILLVVISSVIAVLICNMIGVKIDDTILAPILSSGMGVGLVLLLIGIFLKIYTKIIKPVMGWGADQKRVSAESERPTRLVSAAQVESLPSITEHTTELLRVDGVKDEEQRRAQPGNRA